MSEVCGEMANNVSRRTVLAGIGTAVLAGGFSQPAGAGQGGLKRELAEVRSATARYNDPANAYADGYVAMDHEGSRVELENVVEEAEAVCGMGFHFVNKELFGSTTPTEPPVLVYGVGDDGDLLLGAVEYIVPKGEDDSETVEPDLFDNDDGAERWDEDEPRDGVWSLHAWVHTHNPNGVFSHHNPRKQFSPAGCHGH